MWLGDKRFKSHGDHLENVVADVAIWAVPFGIIGGRLYHVITSPAQYFGVNGNPVDALKIWQGGLGIWGAISLGSVAAYFAYKSQQKKKDLPSFGFFMDALAPGILFAQAIGRLGNWFNGELLVAQQIFHGRSMFQLDCARLTMQHFKHFIRLFCMN